MRISDWSSDVCSSDLKTLTSRLCCAISILNCVMRRRLVRSSPSIQKIALGERQLGRRLADEQLAVGAHLIGFGIDLDVRQRVVQLHLGLAYPACEIGRASRRERVCPYV